VRYLQTYESHSTTEWEYIGQNNLWSTEYQFSVNDSEYRVMFSGTEGVVNVSFGVLEEDKISFGDLEKSNPFKTMKVVTEIIKDFIERFPKVNKIKFFGAQEKSEISKTPDWIMNLLSSNQYLYYLSTYLDSMLLTPRQWISKPTRRTQMFGRWVDKETKDMNWSTKRIGNQIQLIKNKSISESLQDSELSDVVRDIFADLIDDMSDVYSIISWHHTHESGLKDFTIRIKAISDLELRLDDEVIKHIVFCAKYLEENGYKLEMLQTEDYVEVMDIPINDKECGSIVLEDYLESIKDKDFELIQLVFEVPKSN